MGLPITKQIITAHQGNIQSISIPGATVFRIHLPYAKEEGNHFMSSTILIVEDEENARLNISEYMENEGYEVLTACDFKEAQDKVVNDPFDILLLDVLLPDGHGIDILAQTRKLNPTPPVIMVTGQNDVSTAVESMKMGAF